MNHLTPLSIQLAGVLQLIVAAANFFLPKKLQYRANLEKVSPIIRQIFQIHALYIVLVLIGFSVVCLFFPAEIAGSSPLGRFLASFLALFWTIRVPIQLFYYDAEVKHAHPVGSCFFAAVFITLARFYPRLRLCPMNNFSDWLSLALWLAGIGHFCILFASFQVPARLGWKDDLAKLTAFNRKLMWVYGAFTLLTIIAFGTLTLFLHDELLRGERAALALAAFIAVYWTLRIVVDFAYYEHSDWPAGTQFILGHILLTSLFAALASTYRTVLLWYGLSRT